MNVCISIYYTTNQQIVPIICLNTACQLPHVFVHNPKKICIYQYCLYKNGNAKDSNLNSGIMFFDAAQSKEKKTNKQQ